MSKSLSIKIVRLTAMLVGLFVLTNCGEEVNPEPNHETTAHNKRYSLSTARTSSTTPGMVTASDGLRALHAAAGPAAATKPARKSTKRRAGGQRQQRVSFSDMANCLCRCC